MKNKKNVVTTNDSQLGEIVDEILSQFAIGEEPDLAKYEHKYPELAGILRNTIPALRAVADSTRVRDGDQLTSHEDLVAKKLIGDFRLVRQLGRGGMGVVYEATQESLGRRIALKILPFASMVQEKALQRFRNEVRAVASLDHPNIVSVYSVGEDRGVHYYAMQLIRGQSLAEVISQLSAIKLGESPLSEQSIHEVLSSMPDEISQTSDRKTKHSSLEKYLDSTIDAAAQDTQSGDPNSNVETFTSSSNDRHYYHSVAHLGIQAADALQHAHDQGVIHRDIKPGNLMLDAESQLYVTDFGLARIESDVAVTMTGDMIGTLRYMSPEQALAKRVIIDHRSDIYSLGITLYEILVLRPAFEGADRHELFHQIAFGEPRKLRVLDRAIPRELETIIHKAIEKNPDNRYETAVDLGEDLRAFLDNRPIKAKPPNVIQRLGKWTQRHRTNVSIAAIGLIFLLLTSAAILAASLSRESKLRILAEDEAAKAEKSAKTSKEMEAAAVAINSFLQVDLLRSVDPDLEPNRDLTVREVLDRAAESIEGRFESNLIEGGICNTIGRAYLGLGEYEKAEKHLTKARELYESHYGRNHMKAISMRVFVIMVKKRLGGTEYMTKARDELTVLLNDAKEVVAKNNDHKAVDDEIIVMIMTELAWVRNFFHEYKEAVDLLERAFSISTERLGSDHSETMAVTACMASNLLGLARFQESERLYRNVVRVNKKKFKSGHPQVLYSQCNVAVVLGFQKKYAEAERILREVVELGLANGDKRHPKEWQARELLGTILLDQGKVSEALPFFKGAFLSRKQRFGLEYPRTISSLFGLAHATQRLGQAKEAEELLKEVLRLQRNVLGEDHADSIKTRVTLGNALSEQGKFFEAEQIERDGLKLAERILSPKSLDALILKANLTRDLMKQKKFREGERLCSEVVESFRQVRGKNHQDTINMRARLGRFHSMHLQSLNLTQESTAEEKRFAIDLANKAVELRPTRPAPFCDRAIVWQRLGETEKAVRDFGNALRLKTELATILLAIKTVCGKDLSDKSLDKESVNKIAGFLLELFDSMDASRYEFQSRNNLLHVLFSANGKVYSAIESLRPQETHFALCRARFLALQQRWTEAAKSYSQVVVDSQETSDYCEYSAVLLLSGQTREFHEIESQIWDTATLAGEPDEFSNAARTASYATKPSFPMEKILERAKLGTASEPTGWRLHLLALAQYRAQQYDECLKTLAMARKTKYKRKVLDALSGVVQAAKGDREAAEQYRTKIKAYVKEELEDDLSNPKVYTIEWLEINILLNELDSLLKPVTPTSLQPSIK